MKKIIFNIVCLLLCTLFANAQHQYQEINSDLLGEDRRIKIQLPRSYESNPDKEYPIILVLDADYLFEPIGGIVDYLSYWEEIPEAIIIGILQNDKRKNDFNVDEQDYLPFGSGEAFFDFIELELMAFVEKNYRTTPLKIIAGHGESANFANFFMFRTEPLFQAYINFSPFYTPKMKDRIQRALGKTSNKTWYYHGYSTNEPPAQLRAMKDLAIEAELMENENLVFFNDSIPNATHFTSVSQGVANSLEKIFSVFKPITPMEYDQSLYHAESSVEYLTQKYDDIEEFFNLEFDIRINDIMFVSQAIEAKKQWDEYEDLAKIAKEFHPNTLLHSYFLARYQQEIGNPKKALGHYQDAYGYESVGQLTKDLMLIRAEEIKEVFGY